jgi:hypothetical protein
MSTNLTKVAEVKDLLAEIHLQDVRSVVETNKAMVRLSELGYSWQRVQAWLDEEPADKTQDGLFHGFASRKQAAMAVWGAMRKSDRPGALGDTHERVNTLIKVQVPERASATVGIAVVSIPAQQAIAPPEEKVQRFRRLGDGRLKAITERADDFVDVEATVTESPFTMKRAERK